MEEKIKELKDEIILVKNDIKDIKENHLHELYIRVTKIDTKQKIILAILLIITGIILTR